MARLVKVSKVNPPELARIANIIKGYRTSGELAKMLDVNPSTTSRLLNGKISGPISEETIKKLADMITPDMGVTRDALFAANGMAEESRPLPRVDSLNRVRERIRIEQELENIIVQDVSNITFSTWRYSDQISYSMQEGMLRFVPDLVVECKNCHTENHPSNDNWAFLYLETAPYVAGKSHMDLRTAMRFIERMSTLSMMYLQVNHEEAEYDVEYNELPAKISGVVYRPELYDFIIKKYDKLRLPMQTSLILVNLDDHHVEKEFPFSDLNGYRYLSLFTGSYFDDDGNSISEEEYDRLLDEMVEDYMQAEKAAQIKKNKSEETKNNGEGNA